MGNTGDPDRRLVSSPDRRDQRSGLPDAWQDVMPLVYDELRRQARRYLRRERKGHTLQTTALVHEAFLRFAGQFFA